MPKVLIAAASGRVARRVTAALCALGEPPHALVRNPTSLRLAMSWSTIKGLPYR